jgi:hypothetical protein
MRLAASLIAVLVAACAIDGADYDHAAELAALAGGKADSPLPTKRWTFLVYGAADNNLAAFIARDVNELESVGSTEDVNFLAFLDTPDGATVHYLLADDDPATLRSPSASWGAVDSGDWHTLERVGEWAVTTYPADNYVVIVSGHGGGTPRMIAPDDSTGSLMTSPQLAHAIETVTDRTGRKIGVFGADACLMQTIELGVELADKAQFLVASENTEPGTGWDYAALGRALAAAPDTDARALASTMVATFSAAYLDDHASATLAALSSSALIRPPTGAPPYPIASHNASDILYALAQQLQAYAATPGGHAELQAIARDVFRVYTDGDAYADAIDLAERLALSNAPADVRTLALALRDRLREEVVTARWIDPRIADRAHGASIYFPQAAPTADELAGYAEFKLAARTGGWLDAVRAIWAR